MVFVETGSAYLIAGLCSFLAVSISMKNAVDHCKNYTAPQLQMNIVRIIMIVPIYALSSLLSVVFHNDALWFDTVRDIYEAFVIYCFLSLMLEYAGGDGSCVAAMQANPGVVRHPFPFCRLAAIPLNARFLRLCKQGTIQFVIVKPVMAILSLLMLGLDEYHSDAYQWTLITIYNISYAVALYALWLFYVATAHMLRAHSPVRKFFAVKVIIFMTYWQMLFIHNIPGISNIEEGNLWNDWILCIEMVLFAILHTAAFGAGEFKQSGIPDASFLSGVGDILSVRDVVDDTFHNFMPSYQEYVLHKPYEEAPTKTFRARTFIIGNLDTLPERKEQERAREENKQEVMRDISEGSDDSNSRTVNKPDWVGSLDMKEISNQSTAQSQESPVLLTASQKLAQQGDSTGIDVAKELDGYNHHPLRLSSTTQVTSAGSESPSLPILASETVDSSSINEVKSTQSVAFHVPGIEHLSCPGTPESMSGSSTPTQSRHDPPTLAQELTNRLRQTQEMILADERPDDLSDLYDDNLVNQAALENDRSFNAHFDADFS